MNSQSPIYNVNESIGTLTMVNLQSIKQQQNLDYLEHLCLFIDRMNVNPVWYDNQEVMNKMKVLGIYQTAINYSNNLSHSYQVVIKEKEKQIAQKRQQNQSIITKIKDHKQHFIKLKEHYKIKKHKVYKYIYDNLKNKLREQEEVKQYRRQRTNRPSQNASHEIVYYYPGQMEQPRFDPTINLYNQGQHQFGPQHFNPYPQPNYRHPNQPHPNQPQPQPTQREHQFNGKNQRQQQLDHGLTLNKESMKKKGLQLKPTDSKANAGIKTQNIKKEPSQKINNKQSFKRQQTNLQKSQILNSGQKLLQKMEKDISIKDINNSLRQNSNKVMKKQSIKLSESESKKNISGSNHNISEKSSQTNLDQYQYDSIAQIKLDTNSQKTNGIHPPRFQSKIDKKLNNPTTIAEKVPISSPRQIIQQVSLAAEDQKGIFDSGGLGSNLIMNSKFSRNKNKQVQGEKLYEKGKPKRNSHQQPKKPQSILMDAKPQKSNISDSFNIFQSNVGQQIGKIQQGEKMYSSKPKRVINTEQKNQLPPTVKKQVDYLKVSDAKSEDLKNSNAILRSQAVSIRFNNNEEQKNKNPIERDKNEQSYGDDFEDDDDLTELLLHSHLPVSKKQSSQPPDKSQVNIDLNTNNALPENMVSQKYVKLQDQIFTLKTQFSKQAKPIDKSVAISESDNFFDELQSIPMNSRIAKRPSIIHKFQPSKINKQASLNNFSSGQIKDSSFSPSIHVIDPSGHDQKLMGKIAALSIPIIQEPIRESTGNMIILKDQILQDKILQDKIPSKLNQPVEEDDQLQIGELIQNSAISNQSYRQEFEQKILTMIRRVEKQNSIKDTSKFNQTWIEKIVNEKSKVQMLKIKGTEKWIDIQKVLDEELQKVNLQIEKIEKRKQNIRQVSNIKQVLEKPSPKNSSYDDLEYSQSGFKNSSFANRQSLKQGQQIRLIKDMTESITINEVKKVENKYSRNTKPKQTVNTLNILRDVKEGKNAYDVDDPLNDFNTNLLEKAQSSEEDF